MVRKQGGLTFGNGCQKIFFKDIRSSTKMVLPETWSETGMHGVQLLPPGAL